MNENKQDWRIDHSAGRPILVYQNCSVIEAEQAEYVLRLIKADKLRAAGEPVAWTNEAGDVEPISDAVKQARPDLYAKGYTRPLFYAAPQAGAEAIRNAALEEAASLLDGHHSVWLVDRAAYEIRRLKSAPAAEESAKGAGDVESWKTQALLAVGYLCGKNRSKQDEVKTRLISLIENPPIADRQQRKPWPMEEQPDGTVTPVDPIDRQQRAYVADMEDTLNQLADAMGVERRNPERLIEACKQAADRLQRGGDVDAQLLEELRCFIDSAWEEERTHNGIPIRKVSAGSFDNLVCAYRAALAATKGENNG